MPVRGQELGRQLSQVSVLVTGVQGAEGVVRCALFDAPEGFPFGTNEAKALQRVYSEPGWGQAGCVFRDLAQGTYAIAVYHDRNENGILDTNLFGVPKEGVGASQNVIPRIGPPKFDANAFEVGLGVSIRLTVRLRYYSDEECQRAAVSRPCMRQRAGAVAEAGPAEPVAENTKPPLRTERREGFMVAAGLEPATPTM
jgi:uncharacterized protein (DUF2141 family)